MVCLKKPWNFRQTPLAAIFAAITFWLPGLFAENLQTTDGHLYKNVVVIGEEADRVKVKHDDGSGWIAKKIIPAAFAEAHGMQSSTVAAQELADEKKSKDLIINFRFRFREVRTTDARVYPSSEITALETSYLKLQRPGGIERVKLNDLIKEQREALGYDVEKAREFEAEVKRKQEVLKKQEDSKLFAQTSVRGTAIYAHARLVQKVSDGYICSVWQINPPHANATLQEMIEFGGAVADRDPHPSDIVQVSTHALIFSDDLRDFVVVTMDLFPVRVLVMGLPPKVLETKAYRGPLFLVGKYRFDSANDTQKLIPLAFPTISEAEAYVTSRGLGAYLRDDMIPPPPPPDEAPKNVHKRKGKKGFTNLPGGS